VLKIPNGYKGKFLSASCPILVLFYCFNALPTKAMSMPAMAISGIVASAGSLKNIIETPKTKDAAKSTPPSIMSVFGQTFFRASFDSAIPIVYG